MNESQIAGVLTPVLAQFALELEAVEIIPAGKRRLVRVVVDGDGPRGRGPLLDDIAAASKAASVVLDTSDVTGAAAYTLEFSSRGVGRPLQQPRHWRRNAGRLVAVTLVGGDELTGRIVESDETSVALDVEGVARTVAYPDVVKAMIQVELNRRDQDDEGQEED